jgi:hypothetical protein
MTDGWRAREDWLEFFVKSGGEKNTKIRKTKNEKNKKIIGRWKIFLKKIFSK